MKASLSKGSLFLLLALLSLVGVAQCPLDIGQTSAAPTGNLLQYFPFDGNVTNFGGSGQTATNVGASFVPTQCGQGLSFDGVDDYVLVSPNINLTNDFTISAWVTPNVQTNWMGIFSIREQCATSYRGYSIAEFGIGNYNVNGLSQQINQHQNCIGWSGGDRYINPAIAIPNNQASFVAVTVQNNSLDTRAVTLYYNCQEYTTIQSLDWASNVSFSNLINYLTTIGATSSVAGNTNTFDGVIDEVRVYDVALNHDQILDIYHSCLPVGIDVVRFPTCTSDSAQINVHHSQPGVSYQLMDITNGTAVGAAQFGNCSSLTFSTGLVFTTTQFQITAIDTASSCTIQLDSISTLQPSTGSVTAASAIVLCQGDSVLIDGQYVSTAGTFIDTIPISPFCDSIVTYTVTLASLPTVGLGNDTTLCAGQTIMLDATAANATYVWQDGSTNPTLTVVQPGSYSVVVTTGSNCSYSDTIQVAFDSLPSVSLGNDTTLCTGATLVLDASSNNVSYLWQDGSTNPTNAVTQSGVYTVLVTSLNNCTNSDTVQVTFDALPVVDLGNDTTLCTGATLVLDATANNVSYLWQDGSTSPTVVASQSGTYSVLVATSSNCTNSDTVQVTFDPIPAVNLGNDTTLCAGATLLLDATVNNATYVWQDGSTNPSLAITQAGAYSVVVTTPNNCTNSDTVNVTLEALPTVYLGNDTTVCVGATLLLDATTTNANYLWQDGSTDPTFEVTQPGSYLVLVSTNCGSVVDSMAAAYQDCNCAVYVPNAFSPNGDGTNDFFYPQSACAFTAYELLLFNRWGELVFSSTDPSIAWDGTFAGKAVPNGLYTYRLRYTAEVEGTNAFNVTTGHVSVIR